MDGTACVCGRELSAEWGRIEEVQGDWAHHEIRGGVAGHEMVFPGTRC